MVLLPWSCCSVSVCGGSEPVLLFALVVGWFGALFRGGGGDSPIQLRGLTPVSFSGEVSVLFFSFAAFFRFALVYEWWWWCVGAGVFFGAVLCSWFAF
jgi:hypothetical protein